MIGAPPSARVRFIYGFAGVGAGPCLPGGVVCVDLMMPRLLTARTADAAGNATVGLNVPAGAPGGLDIWFQAVWQQGGAGDVTNVEGRTVAP